MHHHSKPSSSQYFPNPKTHSTFHPHPFRQTHRPSRPIPTQTLCIHDCSSLQSSYPARDINSPTKTSSISTNLPNSSYLHITSPSAAIILTISDVTLISRFPPGSLITTKCQATRSNNEEGRNNQKKDAPAAKAPGGPSLDSFSRTQHPRTQTPNPRPQTPKPFFKPCLFQLEIFCHE